MGATEVNREKTQEGKKKEVILEVKNLNKSFGGLKAVDNASLKFYRNEIVGIVGDNGAGKSTLIKMISGAYKKDSGEIILDGKKVEFHSTQDARQAGIETVYQNLGLVELLNAPSNFFLAREKLQEGFLGKLFKALDKTFMKRETDKTLQNLRIKIKNMNAPVNVLSGGQQQSVVVGRAAYWRGKVIILDEPANNLGVEEQRKVLELVLKTRETHNVTFLMISHNLEHIFGISDRIIVMRNGKVVSDKYKKDTDRNEIVSFITGATSEARELVS